MNFYFYFLKTITQQKKEKRISITTISIRMRNILLILSAPSSIYLEEGAVLYKRVKKK